MNFSEFVVDLRILPIRHCSEKNCENIMRSHFKISPGYGTKKKVKKRERKKREKRRGKKVVGGEGQSSATLSLINRATVIDYLE